MNYRRGFPAVPGASSSFWVLAFPSGPIHACGMELGKRIQLERRLRGWSQDELGEKIGVTGKSVSNWERGKHDPRSAVPVLERVFEVSLGDGDPEEVRDAVESALAASELVPWRRDEVRSVYRRNLEAQREERARGSA